MARLVSRFRRQPAQPPPEGEAPPGADAGAAGGRSATYPGALRRERRALVRAREERIRDLGGLMLEMYRRDRFREDLLREQCVELISLEARLHEIDNLLAATRQQVQAARCECGAPLLWGSHFCANCGRPAGEPVVACTNCGHALPAESRFCANCGAPAPLPAEDVSPEAPSSFGPESEGDAAPPPPDVPAGGAPEAGPAAESWPEPGEESGRQRERDPWET